MKPDPSPQDLESEWERAAQVARENQLFATPISSPDHQALDRAAGLQIKSGVKSGDWEIPISTAC